MVSTGNQQAYGNPAWAAGPAGVPPWGGEAFWHHLVNSLAFWIGLTILGFIAWWPIGLALLFFMLGSGRMGCGMHRRHGGGRGGWQRWGGPWAGCQRDPDGRRDQRKWTTFPAWNWILNLSLLRPTVVL